METVKNFSAQFVAAILLSLASLTTLQPTYAQAVAPEISINDLIGTYRVAGRNPDGSGYAGTMTLSKSGTGAQLVWTVGDQKYRGSASVIGNVLSVNWGQKHPVIYVLLDNGELHGTWANGSALERLELIK